MTQVVSLVKQHCIELISSLPCTKYPYHNLQHTKEVVKGIELISKEMSLHEDETILVKIAGWFHDSGFAQTYSGHEEASMKIAHQFLSSVGMDTTQIEIVLSCIEATKMPQKPKNELDAIICDADVMHLTSDDFFYKNLLLRCEWEQICKEKYTDKEWYELNLKFLTDHQFKSSYGKEILQPKLNRNIERMKTLVSYAK